MCAGGGGGGDGGGHLCHLCGYKYASAHPSAKQRRAHRKNCGKPPSATAAAGAEEEGADGRKSLLLPGTPASLWSPVGLLLLCVLVIFA